jgi:hypothetical protein
MHADIAGIGDANYMNVGMPIVISAAFLWAHSRA